MSQGLNRVSMVRHGIDGAVNLARRRTWFADEAQQPGSDSSSAAQSDASTEQVPDWVKDPAKAYEEIRKLRASEAQTRTSARELEKRLEAIEKARQAADEQTLVQQNEWKTIAEKRTEELAKQQSDHMKFVAKLIALEMGIPKESADEFAGRLKGATEDELRADAEKLKALIPQAPGAQKPSTTTTAVPGGQPAKETDAQRRARLYGGSGNALGKGKR